MSLFSSYFLFIYFFSFYNILHDIIYILYSFERNIDYLYRVYEVYNK